MLNEWITADGVTIFLAFFILIFQGRIWPINEYTLKHTSLILILSGFYVAKRLIGKCLN